jgi:5-formyltetrahydrofolate cyclo-ligase
MIMPLVAFDENRNRIGYGGGFYDRFLTRFKNITTAAIAFDCQRSDDLITAEEFDMSPGMIITESGIFM